MGNIPEELYEHPVVGVSFFDVLAFLPLGTPGNRLAGAPAQRTRMEKAARGSDGQIYPWGDLWDASVTNTRESKIGATTPVGKFSPQGDSPYGLADMAGNVQSWISSLFGPYPYEPTDGREILVYDLNPGELLPRIHETGCTAIPESLEAGLDKSMIRGGSWRESKLQSRCAYRSWAAPMHRSDDTGFRLCYEAE